VIEEIGRKLKQIGRQDTDTTIMEVVSVDKSEGTCVCYDGELEHTDVRLSAIIDVELKKQYFLFPKVGSTVLVTPIDNDYNYQFVSAISEPEEMFLRIGDTTFQIDENGFLIKRESETLRKLIVDLIEEIKAMKFTTNSGPTIKLINAPKFTAIENRFKQLLKDS
jgi:hypothetical protein